MSKCRSERRAAAEHPPFAWAVVVLAVEVEEDVAAAGAGGLDLAAALVLPEAGPEAVGLEEVGEGGRLLAAEGDAQAGAVGLPVRSGIGTQWVEVPREFWRRRLLVGPHSAMASPAYTGRACREKWHRGHPGC